MTGVLKTFSGKAEAKVFASTLNSQGRHLFAVYSVWREGAGVPFPLHGGAFTAVSDSVSFPSWWVPAVILFYN